MEEKEKDKPACSIMAGGKKKKRDRHTVQARRQASSQHGGKLILNSSMYILLLIYKLQQAWGYKLNDVEVGELKSEATRRRLGRGVLLRKVKPGS